jgi:hypothetical protein
MAEGLGEKRVEEYEKLDLANNEPTYHVKLYPYI